MNGKHLVRRMRPRHKFIALLLSIAVALSALSIPAWAVEGDTLCDHVCTEDSGCISYDIDPESGESVPIISCTHFCGDGTCSNVAADPEGPSEPVEEPVIAGAPTETVLPADLPINPETGEIDYDALTPEQLAALLAAQGGIMPMSVGITPESEWIIAANSVIDGRGTAAGTWEAYLRDCYYQNVTYDETGVLAWVTSSGVPWNGKDHDDLTPQTAVSVTDQQTAASTGIGHEDYAPALDAASKIYYVYSPQQLLYAFRELNNKSGYTIKIMENLDFNGANYSWPTDVTLEDFTTIDGATSGVSGHYMDNLRILQDTTVGAMNCGLISTCTSLRAKGLYFRNAHVCSTSKGSSKTAIFVGYPNVGVSYDYANYWQLEDITFQDCLVVNNSNTDSTAQGSAAALLGRYIITDGTGMNLSMPDAYIKNCNTIDCVFAGGSHTASLTSTLNNMGKVQNCFSVGGTVISYGLHSGGLISCMYKVSEISGCFVDTKLYGSQTNGVFTGEAANCHFYSCFTSGFIEGESILGGFVGNTGAGADTTIVDCYSTALVGIRSSINSKTQGGFIGNMSGVSGYNMGLVNCYAAGEVGSAATEVETGASGTAHTNSSGTKDYIGGFVGNYGSAGSREQIAFCYYDKQTTAMREWDNGASKQSYLNVTGQSNPSCLTGVVKKDDVGLRGVLTTDTTKFGAGLMGKADTSNLDANGFVGFLDLEDFYGYDTTDYAAGKAPYKTTVDYYGWADEATTDPNHEHYPELQYFANADSAIWGEYTDLVKAYSKASTSGPQLEPWEQRLNVADGTLTGGTLSPNVYDTVRDLTLRFDLTTEGDQQWYVTQTATGADNTHATVDILGEERNVLEMEAPNVDFKMYNYSADYFSPGLEWLATDVTINGVTARRRLRVMPTAGLDAGESITIVGETKYDHADDVELYFSTASRMDAAAQAGTSDITTGIFPDTSDGTATVSIGDPPVSTTVNANALTDRQLALMGKTESEINAMFNDASGTNKGNDDFTNVPVVDYMTKTGTDNATDSKLFVYGTKIASFDPLTGEVKYASSDKLNFADPTNNTQVRYNGYQSFENLNARYLLEYVWELTDGRVIRDAKIVQIKAVPFLVQMYVQHSDCDWSDGEVATFPNGGLDHYDTSGNKDDTHRGTANAEDVLINIGDIPTVTDKDDVKWPQPLTADPLAGVDTTAAHTESDLTNQKYMYGYPAYTAWQLTGDDAKKYKKVTALTLQMGNDEFGWATKTIRNPKAGDKVTVNYTYYNFIRNTDGNYYTIPESATRTYEVKQYGTTNTFYLAFDKQNEEATTTLGNKIMLDDVEDEIIVTLTVSEYMTVKKEVKGSLGDHLKDFSFTANLSDLTEGSDYTYYKYTEATDGTTTETPVTITVPADKNVTFQLKHEEYVIFPDLIAGDNYTVTENSYQTDGYTTQLKDTNNASYADWASSLTTYATELGISSTEKDIKHENLTQFRNSRDPSAPTGVLLDNGPFLLLFLLSLGGTALWQNERQKRRRKRRARGNR